MFCCAVKCCVLANVQFNSWASIIYRVLHIINKYMWAKDIHSTNIITSIMIRTMFCLFFKDRLSLCSPGWLGTSYIDQAGLDLVAIFLPLLWGQGMPPCLGHVLSSLNITSSERRMNSKGRVPNRSPVRWDRVRVYLSPHLCPSLSAERIT